jgi:hypothetical protein
VAKECGSLRIDVNYEQLVEADFHQTVLAGAESQIPIYQRDRSADVVAHMGDHAVAYYHPGRKKETNLAGFVCPGLPLSAGPGHQIFIAIVGRNSC